MIILGFFDISASFRNLNFSKLQDNNTIITQSMPWNPETTFENDQNILREYTDESTGKGPLKIWTKYS